jgi:hypothetical protein
MARRKILRVSAAGVQLIEVVYQMSQRVFSRYVVTTQCGRSRRDFVNMRTARRAFDEAVAMTGPPSGPAAITGVGRLHGQGAVGVMVRLGDSNT